ncbi:protein CFAP20DC [Dryobates pubescens]|uniref:protein CFAP20DC n=1 Tax=Dryobates pubescens TaxID=118200 RepID=UPI0023B95053|nr:protein CFAP20DC [Dryobates pubescens]
MFKNQYQGGPFVEIFSAQGKNPVAKWKIYGNPSAIRKEYDKEIKSFVFVLEGSSQVNKMQLPKEATQTLGLIQPFLTLQVFVPLGQEFSTVLMITDLGNIKRRLYLSTVRKEVSVTPLHAIIPLVMIKRKIWCNMCIDLIAFTSEIFRGAVFQSLDGITVSANCKLRKIFTLKSKPRDTSEEDGVCVPFMTCGPTDAIPQTCQLNTDVPQVTQLLNLTTMQKPGMKSRKDPVTVQETGSPVSRGQGNIYSSKAQVVSHTAFGSKILGTPPATSRKVSAKVSGKVTKTWGGKDIRTCRLQSSRRETESVQNVEGLELSFSPCRDSFDEAVKRNTHKTIRDLPLNDLAIQTEKTSESERAYLQLLSPQGPSAVKNSRRRLSPENTAKDTWEINSDECLLPESFTKNMQMDWSEQFIATEDSTCCNLTSPQNTSVEDHSNETGDHQVNNKEIFTFSSRPPSAPHEMSPSMSPESCIFPLDLKQDSNGIHGKTQIEDNFEGTDSSGEDDNNELIRGTEKLEISSSRQGTSDSAVFQENTLKRMSWENESWKNKEHSKHCLEETILSEPQSSTVRKTDSLSSLRSLKPTLSLSPPKFLTGIPYGAKNTETCEEVPGQLKRSISKMSPKEISRENSRLTTQTCEYDWKKDQSNNQSSSELQMLASMKRQQNEEFQDIEISRGLSTSSQIANCKVSDDTATWNSCCPPAVSQEHHYQKERSPPSLSNPRDWLNTLSPPVSSGSQHLEEHTEPSTTQNTPGEDELSTEEDEVLTLLYDRCLNCYFDPNSGKYYELA